MVEDSELLRRFAVEHDQAAFAELVNRRIDFVYASALRRVGGDEHLAKDVTQQVFVALARQVAALLDRPVLGGWLFLTTRNVAAQVVRTERRRRSHEQEVFAMQVLSSPDPALEWERVRPVIDHALDELHEQDREAVLLRFFEHRSFAEVGVSLRLTENAARMRVARALDKLHAQLARLGITSTTTALSLALAHQTGIAAPAELAAKVTSAALSVGSVATTLGSLAGIGGIMTTTKVTIATLAAGIIGFGFYWTYRAPTEAERSDVRPVLAAANAPERVAPTQPPPRFEATLKPIETSAKRMAFQPAPIEATRPALEQPVAGFVSFRPATGSDEEDRKLVREINGRGIDSIYDAFYRQMEFTPEQRDQFRELVLDLRERGGELFRKAVADERARNSAANRSDLQDVADATFEHTEMETVIAVRAVFGEATAEAVERYARTLPARYVTNLVARTLADTSSALSDAQTDALTQIITHHSRTANGRLNPTTMNRDAVLAEAEAILSAPQLIELRRVTDAGD